MAAAMPSTSRLGTMLVNSEPGARASRPGSARAVGAGGGAVAVPQQIGEDAGKQRTGAGGDQVGRGDGGEGGGHGADLARPQANGLDAMLAAADAGFADDDGAVGEGGFPGDAGGCAGVDAAGDFEDFRGGRDGVGEIAGRIYPST